MSTAIHRRLDLLQAARTRQDKRKGVVTFIEEIRQHLESVDGQAEIGTVPGEGLWNEMVRRLQGTDGWNLAGIPGGTWDDKIKAIDDQGINPIAISPEARHAARHWFAMVEGL